MEDLQKQIASLVEQEANKKAASILERLAAFITDLQKEISGQPSTEADTKEKSMPVAAAADAPIQVQLVERRHTRQVKLLESEITRLKKELKRERHYNLKGTQTIIELEQRRKEEHNRAQRLQLRLNTYERTKPKPMLLLPAHASPGSPPVEPATTTPHDITPQARVCDICGDPIPETRRWNAKRCSERCDRIRLIKEKPALMLHSPILKEIGIEEGLWHEFQLTRQGYVNPKQVMRQRARRNREKLERKVETSAAAGLKVSDAPPLTQPDIPKAADATSQSEPTPAAEVKNAPASKSKEYHTQYMREYRERLKQGGGVITERKQRPLTSTNPRAAYLRQKNRERYQKSIDSRLPTNRCAYCTKPTARKLYCSEACRKAGEAQAMLFNPMIVDPARPGAYIEKVDWKELQKRSDELLARRLPPRKAEDDALIAAATEKVRRENSDLDSIPVLREWRAQKRRQSEAAAS